MNHRHCCFLIENDEDDRDIFRLALEAVSPAIAFRAANNGKEALSLLEANPSFQPTLIFIDMNMPIMDGLECATVILKMERLKGIAVYLYSTAAAPRTMAQARAVGVTDFLIKPARFNEQVQLLSNLLEVQPA